MIKGKFNIVIGAQAGSESKGKLSTYLCDKRKPDLLVMTASPNAGHTAIVDGVKYVSYHLPVGSVVTDCPIVLGPASLINIETFPGEIESLGIDPRRIHVDSRASIITRSHLSEEKGQGLSDIGSTLQGVGACRINKMRRRGDQILAGSMREEELGGVEILSDTSYFINLVMGSGGTVLCEATQGFDLDLEHGIHPVYCTSKMINPAMVMAEAGVSPKMVGMIYGVIRPYPIRVNNRTGTSGPYTGSVEITWEEVARRCKAPYPIKELTTTTKLPRRVFEFSHVRFSKFVQVCRPDRICLQFANYIDWDVYGARGCGLTALTPKVRRWIARLERDHGVLVTYVGTGPDHEDMVEIPSGIEGDPE